MKVVAASLSVHSTVIELLLNLPYLERYLDKASADAGALLYLAYLLLIKDYYKGLYAEAGCILGESKMKRLLPLSLLVSTLLTGCGTDSGVDGGGSTSPQPSQNVTFEFVQLRPANEALSETCTFFDGTEQNSDAKTYGKVAGDVTVEVYHADGTFDKALAVSSEGVLKFAMNDVEDDGYVSVIDSPSDSDHFYKVLSIQKELLGNYVININRNQGNVDCYTGGKGIATITGYASVSPNGIHLNAYDYESSHLTLLREADYSVKMIADSGENVLTKAYNNDVLVGYAFVPNLSNKQFLDPPTPLKDVDTNAYQWTIGQTITANELEKVTIRLGNGNYSYPWNEPQFNKADGSTVGFPFVATESNWFYSAKGKTTKNWNFVRNGALLASLAVELPDSLTLEDNSPAIEADGDSFAFKVPGVSSTEKVVQRSHYTVKNADSSVTLNHSIYSIPSGDGDVVIPKLKFANLAPAKAADLEPVNGENLSVAVIETTARNAELIESFMRSYPGDELVDDLVSVVLTPAERIAHQKVVNMSNYTLVER